MKPRALMRPYALLHLYMRRLRTHAVQELLAALGVAVAVALVFGVVVANGSIAGSAGEVVRAVTGPANLQIHARGQGGIDERLLRRIERLPGVVNAAPLLEETATIWQGSRRVGVDLAGADLRLVMMDHLVRTLPIATLSPGGVTLTSASAAALGISGHRSGKQTVSLALDGYFHRLPVSAVIGAAAIGALSQAQVALMPLSRMQRLAGMRGRVSRILVQARSGRQAQVSAQLRALAGRGLEVSAANEDLSLLRQALRPSDEASSFFAAIAALLGFLFAFNAMLLTVPERRRTIADLRLLGTRRSAIVQMVLFQALCLGVLASAAGLACGYLLSAGAFHQSVGYLAEAFTLGRRTVIPAGTAAASFAGGVLVTCLASAVPLLDLRSRRSVDAVYGEKGVPGDALAGGAQRALTLGAILLLALSGAILALWPQLALLACAVLALATVLSVPIVLRWALASARSIAEGRAGLTALPVALTGMRSATVRSLALAATGAVALFGAVALGGARSDLLRGIGRFAKAYAADASIWVSSPHDNQATVAFSPRDYGSAIAAVPGVANVRSFQGGFLVLAGRRVWVIARPPGAARHVLAQQLLEGSAAQASRRLAEGGWIVVSKQIAQALSVDVGGVLRLPTPVGERSFRVAATTTNLAWPPGVVFLGAADYARYWGTSDLTAFGVQVRSGASVSQVRKRIAALLPADSGLEAVSAGTLERRIDKLAGEGLGRLGEIAILLELAAIVAMVAALASSIWQRRLSLAALRLCGAPPHRLRRILMLESGLMLGAGALAGALVGIYGEVVIDAYLRDVTGFPIASIGASIGPLETIGIVLAIVAAISLLPVWLASKVSPALALGD